MRTAALALGLLGLAPQAFAGPEAPRAQVVILPQSFVGFGLSPDGASVLGTDSGVGGGAVWRDGRIVPLERDPERRVFGFGAASSRRARVVSEVGFVPGATIWRNGRRIVLAPGGEARGVSANGRVVVGFVLDPVQWKIGMRWVDEVGAPITAPGGFQALWAHAVSADGNSIFGAGTFNGGPITRFLWRDGEAIPLAGLPYASEPFTNLSPYGVSWMELSSDGTTVANADVVGDLACQASCGTVIEAWRWRDGNVEGLGVARPGDSSSIPYGISANGGVVVGSSGGSETGTTPFVWDRAHGMRSLEDLLVNLGADLQDFELDSAWGVSDDGRHIMGPARDPNLPHVDYTYFATLPPACADRVDFAEDAGCGSRMDSRE